MSITELNFVKKFIKMSNDGYMRGWHERNGGNLTYRLKADEAVEFHNIASIGTTELRAIGGGIALPKLAGELFLVTGSGKFFGNVSDAPSENIGIVELDGNGENYRVLWGFDNGAVPTSELPSHLMNHEAKISAKGDDYRIIYHCHPANIIALTFILPLNDEMFTRELWQMISECAIVFPDGVGVMPWMIPGSIEIAVQSSRLMREYDVIVWAHHGIFCAERDFDTAFGLADTVEKAAEILVKVLSVTNNKRQSISDENLHALAKAFNVSLPKKFFNK